MTVKVYNDAGTYRTLTAEEVPVLRRIFEGEDVLAPPPPPPPRGPGRPVPRSKRGRIGPEASEPALQPAETEERAAAEEVPSADAPALPAGPPNADVQPVQKKPRWLPAAFAFIAGGVLVYSMVSGDGADPAGNSVEADSAPQPEYTETGPQRDFYVLRTTNLRGGPKGQRSPKLGALGRGDRITGVLVRGTENGVEYVLVKTGEHRGTFLWAANVSTTAPPPLAATVRESRELLREVVLRSGPSSDAAFLMLPTDKLAAGASAQLAGRTQNGWYEVLREGGGVGYVEASVIERPGLEFSLENSCHRALNYWMIYQSPTGSDDGGPGYWTIEPYKTTKLKTSESVPLSMSSPSFRFYAKSTDGITLWSNTDGSLHGRDSLPMREATATMEPTGYRFTLTCSN